MRLRHLATFASAVGLVSGAVLVAQPADAATADCSTYQYVRTGTVSPGKVDIPYQWLVALTNPGKYDICLDGPDGADIDLELTALPPDDARVVAADLSTGSDKTLTYTGPLTEAYRVRLTTLSGSGTYTIGVNLS